MKIYLSLILSPIRKISVLFLLLIAPALLSGCATMWTQNGDASGPHPEVGKNIYESYQCRKDDGSIIYISSRIDFGLMVYPFVGDNTRSNDAGPLGLLGLIYYPGIIIVGIVDLPFSLLTDSVLLPYTIHKTYVTCRDKTKKEEAIYNETIKNEPTPNEIIIVDIHYRPHIYITEKKYLIVRVNDLTGSGWTTCGTQFWGNKFNDPTGIFEDLDGKIYVVDKGFSRISRMDDMTGKNLTVLGAPAGNRPADFSHPEGIFVDSNRIIYVADTGNDRIVRVDNMNYLGWTTFGTSGKGINQFYNPTGIFVDKAGKIYVLDTGNNRIIRMDGMNGSGWISFGNYGNGINQFNHPTGIFGDTSGRIYVADEGNGRIVQINDMSGSVWSDFYPKNNENNKPAIPHNISVDNMGKIYVTDTKNNQVIQIDDMAGTNLTILQDDNRKTSLYAPTGIFSYTPKIPPPTPIIPQPVMPAQPITLPRFNE